MTIDSISEIATNATWMILMLSLPSLSAAMIVGVAISLFQAVTQIQEQTLTFVPKIIATLFVIALTANWATSKLVAFTQSLFNMIPTLGT